MLPWFSQCSVCSEEWHLRFRTCAVRTRHAPAVRTLHPFHLRPDASLPPSSLSSCSLPLSLLLLTAAALLGTPGHAGHCHPNQRLDMEGKSCLTCTVTLGFMHCQPQTFPLVSRPSIFNFSDGNVLFTSHRPFISPFLPTSASFYSFHSTASRFLGSLCFPL